MAGLQVGSIPNVAKKNPGANIIRVGRDTLILEGEPQTHPSSSKWEDSHLVAKPASHEVFLCGITCVSTQRNHEIKPGSFRFLDNTISFKCVFLYVFTRKPFCFLLLLLSLTTVFSRSAGGRRFSRLLVSEAPATFIRQNNRKLYLCNVGLDSFQRGQNGMKTIALYLKKSSVK